MFGFPGMLYPWFAIYMALIAVSYAFFTPEFDTMRTWGWGWVAEITLRNVVILALWNGAFHLWFMRLRMQGRKKKYNANWMSKNNATFLFNDQVYDNVFWSLNGAVIWSGYECFMWWMYANDRLPFISFDSNPIYFCLLMLAVPFWRNFHFYCIHRLIHWKPLYDWVHYVHHKNVNVGPWSGLAMHPVEHLCISAAS